MPFIFWSRMQQRFSTEAVGEGDKISSEDSSSSRVQAVGEQAHVVTLTTFTGFPVFMERTQVACTRCTIFEKIAVAYLTQTVTL